MDYRKRQRLHAEPKLIASSAELREYQRKHKTSALRIARLAKAKIDAQGS